VKKLSNAENATHAITWAATYDEIINTTRYSARDTTNTTVHKAADVIRGATFDSTRDAVEKALKEFDKWKIWIIPLILSIITSTTATAGPQGNYRLLELDSLSTEVWKIGDNRDPYFPYSRPGDSNSTEEEWYGGAAFQINTTLIQIKLWSIYWNNHPYMNGTRHQVRQAGWEWEAGGSYSRCLDLYWLHHSTHLLDQSSPYPYPLINRFGVRVTFFDRDKKCWGAN
jgi:hypothetical protein